MPIAGCNNATHSFGSHRSKVSSLATHFDPHVVLTAVHIALTSLLSKHHCSSLACDAAS